MDSYALKGSISLNNPSIQFLVQRPQKAYPSINLLSSQKFFELELKIFVDKSVLLVMYLHLQVFLRGPTFFYHCRQIKVYQNLTPNFRLWGEIFCEGPYTLQVRGSAGKHPTVVQIKLQQPYPDP